MLVLMLFSVKFWNPYKCPGVREIILQLDDKTVYSHQNERWRRIFSDAGKCSQCSVKGKEGHVKYRRYNVTSFLENASYYTQYLMYNIHT